MKTYSTIIASAIFALFFSGRLHGQVMTTIAGQIGVIGDSGDGGPAGNATFHNPYALAVDKKGNVFIADVLNSKVRVINKAGMISTYAGGGPGLTGDYGPATAMSFSPISLAADGNGTLYISTGGYVATEACKIFKVDTMGIISIFAGTGVLGYSGDSGLATAAAIYGGSCIAVDPKGNVYFIDNGRIRKVDLSGIITTVAGNGVAYDYSGDGGYAINAGLGYVVGIAVDSMGNIYLSDEVNCTIRKVDTSGIINLFAGPEPVTSVRSNGCSGDGGPASAARLSSPFGLAIDGSGNLYVADGGNEVIRKINAAGIISTVAGTDTVGGYGGDGGPATNAKMYEPGAVAVDTGGNLYIIDYFNILIRKVIKNGIVGVHTPLAVALEIFPNPVVYPGILHICHVPTASDYRVLSIVGAEVQSGRLQPGSNAISLQTLPPDVYILEITYDNGEKTTTKIMRQ